MDKKIDSQNTLPTTFIILGATGDLMRQKLIPALFHLYRTGSLPTFFQVVGFARDDLNREGFQQMVREMAKAKVEASEEEITAFAKFFTYTKGTFEEKDGYTKLAEFLGYKDKSWKVCSNKLFYLAVPPQHYKTILKNLHSSGLGEPCSPEEGWTRIIVEKPFGKDLATAQELDKLLGKLFDEEQIYRMDHYLGKETVQNILAFRFSNSFLEPAWNKDWIESITIRLRYPEDIEGRGAFYDGIGALRDVGQSHMLQLLALFLMENPTTFEGDAVRKARAEVLNSLPTLKEKDLSLKTTRGQYKGYLEENDVAKDSKTETYFKIKASLNNSRWKGVKIILENGKAMEKEDGSVEVVFLHRSPCLCPDPNNHQKNVLRYEIQPIEQIIMKFWVKRPGSTMQLEERNFTFDYKQAFEGEEFADAYERLLHNIIQGDQTLFVSTEEIMASWKFVDSILRGWEKTNAPLVVYPKGASTVET